MNQWSACVVAVSGRIKAVFVKKWWVYLLKVNSPLTCSLWAESRELVFGLNAYCKWWGHMNDGNCLFVVHFGTYSLVKLLKIRIFPIWTIILILFCHKLWAVSALIFVDLFRFSINEADCHFLICPDWTFCNSEALCSICIECAHLTRYFNFNWLLSWRFPVVPMNEEWTIYKKPVIWDLWPLIDYRLLRVKQWCNTKRDKGMGCRVILTDTLSVINTKNRCSIWKIWSSILTAIHCFWTVHEGER